MMDYLPRTVQPTADDYNALVDAMNAMLAGGSSADSSYIPSGIGGGTVNVGPQPIWAQITGGGSGGIYSWTRVVPTGTGTFSAPPFPDNVAGTTGYLWAAEATGRTDVPVDGSAIVRLEQSEVGPWFDFKYTAAAATTGSKQSLYVVQGGSYPWAGAGSVETPVIIAPGASCEFTMSTTAQISIAGSGTVQGYFQLRAANFSGPFPISSEWIVDNNQYASVTGSLPYYLNSTGSTTIVQNQTYSRTFAYTNTTTGNVGLYPRVVTGFSASNSVLFLACWSAFGVAVNSSIIPTAPSPA